MNEDFSWEQSALKYIQLYEKLKGWDNGNISINISRRKRI
jgi:hypothetical protein